MRVSERELVARIAERSDSAGLALPADLAAALAGYLGLLTKWNRRINLTAHELEPPSDAAIDHLILEPLIAARHVPDAARLALDVGSGGGSPGVPLALALPRLQLTLVESRTRKASFLREVARQLSLGSVTVENARLEEVAALAGFQQTVDLVTLRAVQPDEPLVRGLERTLSSRGLVFWFTTESAELSEALRTGALRLEAAHELVPGSRARLLVMRHASH